MTLTFGDLNKFYAVDEVMKQSRKTNLRQSFFRMLIVVKGKWKIILIARHRLTLIAGTYQSAKVRRIKSWIHRWPKLEQTIVCSDVHNEYDESLFNFTTPNAHVGALMLLRVDTFPLMARKKMLQSIFHYNQTFGTFEPVVITIRLWHRWPRIRSVENVLSRNQQIKNWWTLVVVGT